MTRLARPLLAIVLWWLGFAPATTHGQDDDAPPVQVAFLVLDGVYNSELMAPLDIFHHTVFHTKPGMRAFLVGRTMETVTSFEGLRIEVDYDLASAPPFDVLVIPSAEHNLDTDLADEPLIRWIAERGRTARHLVSVCDGAFLLAEAGLLDGLRCTTFPGDIDTFRQRYPRLNVVEGVSFVADGRAITGVGGARSYDPAMYLVHTMFGEKVATGVGRGMVLRWDPGTVRHLAMPSTGADVSCYLPGDRVDPGVAFEDAEGRPVTLGEIVAAPPADFGAVRAVVLTVIAGAEGVPGRGRGGLWCEDSFSEVPPLRHLRLDYGAKGVLFVGVLCPPVYHETDFGFDEGVFLNRGNDDEVYRRNHRRFVAASEELVAADQLPFDVVVYDPRFRLLANPDRGVPAPEIGERPGWQGRFKWFEDDQAYGTPTTWVLTPDLEIPGPPFFANVYESEGRKLRYSVHDVADLLDRVLARRPR